MFSSKPRFKQTSKTIQVKSNHFPLTFSNRTLIHRYSLSTFEGEQDLIKIGILLKSCQKPLNLLFGKSYWVSGSQLYSTSLIEADNLIVTEGPHELALQTNGAPLNIANIADPSSANHSDLIQFLNIYLGHLMKKHSYSEYGRSGKFFNFDQPGGKVRGFDIKVLSGFKLWVGLYEDNVPKVMVDWVSRVTREDTILDWYWETQDKRMTWDQFMHPIIGSSYVHMPEKKIVKIKGIDDKTLATDQHPDPEFKDWIDFYKKRYGFKVTDPQQWLAFGLTGWKTKMVDGKEKRYKDRIYYLPEFLKATGLTQDMKNDYRLMNSLAKETKLEPWERWRRVMSMAKILNSCQEDLGVSLDLANTSYSALQMSAPKITFGGGKSQIPANGNFFSPQFFEKTNLKNWVVVWEDDADFKKAAMNGILSSTKSLGMRFTKPHFIQMPELERGKTRSPGHIRKACTFAMKKKPQLIMFIISKYTAKRGYTLIKKCCSADKGVLTQVLLIDPRKIGKRGVFDKLATQIASKAGFAPWKVQNPAVPSNPRKKNPVMIIGADVYHKKGSESIAAVVGSTNCEFTKFASFHSAQSTRGIEIMDKVANHVIECVEEFFKKNKFLPSTLIFYRDGVGQGQFRDVKTKEIRAITEGLQDRYQAKRPKLIFIVVTKRINDRFFWEPKLGLLQNPKNGLIVHSANSNSGYVDFFMVAQNVTQGTATPTRYQVILNETEDVVDPSYFYKLTYFQTYNYYNWSGPVRVPSVCQYAHKLAYLVGETYRKDTTHFNLKSNLHFL